MADAIRSLLPSIGRDVRGASVIETALVLPILITLFAGATDFAMGFMVKMHTQQAATRSIELAYAGGLADLSAATLKEEAEKAIDDPTADIEANEWLDCVQPDGTVTEGDVGVGCDSGTPNRYVDVRISNSYSPMFAALLPAGVAPDGKISFTGYSSLRLQ